MKFKVHIAVYTLFASIFFLCLWNCSWATCTHDYITDDNSSFSYSYCKGQCSDISAVDCTKDHIQENVLGRSRTSTRIKSKNWGLVYFPQSIRITFPKQIVATQYAYLNRSIVTQPYYYQFLFRLALF